MPTEQATPPLVSVRDLAVHFHSGGGLFGGQTRVVKAVDGVSFDIPHAQTVGVVGESGSGKTTIGRAILRLIPATAGTVMLAALPVSVPMAAL